MPKHSNPTGETYSSKVLEELAKLPKKASKDFMIFYDNAYSVHDFKKIQKIRETYSISVKSLRLLTISLCFASTSKITFAGAGVSFSSFRKSTSKFS